MKVKDIIDESWIPIYSTMKKYGLRRAKHSNGTPYFKEIKDVKKVEIREDRSVKLSLLFDKDHNFDKKVLKEQFSF